MSNTRPGLDVRRADAQYRSFPSFAEWAASASIDTARWDRYAGLLQQRKELSPELLARAREVAKRAAAVDTGAIEGLYEVDRGFTFSVAMQMATWEAQMDAKGSTVRSLIEAQLNAYDFVLDFATKVQPVAEAWIRTLHEVMCKGQETYSVYTEIGLQEQALPLGKYKTLPNHVLKADGVSHSYAPVEHVPAEMQRLRDELESAQFAEAHPVLQASYAHYAFVVIHPFADGNGRVARALASIFTYRALSVPLLILAEHRSEYYAALEEADESRYQPFVDFTMERTLDSIQLVSDTLKAAGAPAPIEAAAQLKRVYLTRSGFTHPEVDKAGYSLFDAFVAEVEKQAKALGTGELTIRCEVKHVSESLGSPSYRHPTTLGSRLVDIHFQTSPPAYVAIKTRVTLEVPKHSGGGDDLLLRCIETKQEFESRISEAYPTVTGTLHLRLAVFVHGLLGEAISELTKMAAEVMRNQGY